MVSVLVPSYPVLVSYARIGRMFGPLITFETTNVFDTILRAVDSRAIYGLDVRLVVSLKQFSALEGA